MEPTRLTPERLRDIEAQHKQWQTLLDDMKPSDKFAVQAVCNIGDLLAALKQVTEERDGFAAGLGRARNAFRLLEKNTSDSNAAILCSDLHGLLADPAACLKARDAEIAKEYLMPDADFHVDAETQCWVGTYHKHDLVTSGQTLAEANRNLIGVVTAHETLLHLRQSGMIGAQKDPP